MVTIADLSNEPQYTIKVVSGQTGIRAVTIRAWERRYRLLQPQRGDNRYRRYSEQDIALLQWAKSRVESGIAISNVAGELSGMRQKGIWPEIVPGFQPFPGIRDRRPPEQLAEELYGALTHHKEADAEDVLRAAQSTYDLDVVCLQVITPCLIEIGEAWHRGEIRIATEHFASTFLRAKVSNYLLAFPSRKGSPYIITGCAPGERHEIGALILSVLLRRAGYRVEFLGADVPLEDLVDYAGYERPQMVCLSATVEQTAFSLASLQEKLNRLKAPPLFAFGGRAFVRNPGLRSTTPGLYLGDTAGEAVGKVGQLLEAATPT